MLPRGLVLFAPQVLQSFVYFRLQLGGDDRRTAGAVGGSDLRLGVQVNKHQEVRAATHNGSMLTGSLIAGGAHFDFVFTTLNAGKSGVRAVLGWSGQVHAAEIRVQLDEGVAGKRHAIGFANAYNHGYGAFHQTGSWTPAARRGTLRKKRS